VLSLIAPIEKSHASLAQFRTETKYGRLFDAILDSQDVGLSSEVVGQLSEKDLTVTLEWLVEGDWTVALRPQWISYLRRYQNKVLAWGNNHEPSKPLLVILANVIDFRSDVIPDFSKKTTLGLASVAGPLIRERHEVAAFVYVTTTYVNEPVAASHCVTAFAILHAAIAESRLSNRAWQILEQNLMPLPSEQWDACEKLQRSIIHFIFLDRWPIESLWNLISGILIYSTILFGQPNPMIRADLFSPACAIREYRASLISPSSNTKRSRSFSDDS
jgi:hypothetical protein